MQQHCRTHGMSLSSAVGQTLKKECEARANTVRHDAEARLVMHDGLDGMKVLRQRQSVLQALEGAMDRGQKLRCQRRLNALATQGVLRQRLLRYLGADHDLSTCIAAIPAEMRLALAHEHESGNSALRNFTREVRNMGRGNHVGLSGKKAWPACLCL